MTSTEDKNSDLIPELQATAEECEREVKRLDLIARKRPLHPHELVEKGRCVQLIPETSSGALEDAEIAFRAAVGIDAEYLPAYLELGWFNHRTRDDPATGVLFFEQAIELCQRWLEEARSGRAECLEELEEMRQDETRGEGVD